MKKIELLAPAGDIEKLKAAVDYGADAVYFGGKTGSLRAAAGNLSVPEIYEGVQYCHQRGKKAYLTLNIYAHNEDIEKLKSFVGSVKDSGLDAFIVSDPAVMEIVRALVPDAELHLSTQANVTSYESAKFWYGQGIRRLILARELTLKEISSIYGEIPKDMELEIFVHGAMCISYSGRCLLSNFLADRDGNRGECAQPCRWNYELMEESNPGEYKLADESKPRKLYLEEELRPGEYFPIEEDERGTYILNSKDLCLIRHIPELAASGVVSAKIEGRMKSAYYVATVVRAYRKAIDEFYKDPGTYEFQECWWDELLKASHREFTTGFFFHKATGEDQDYLTSGYIRGMTFVGVVRGCGEEGSCGEDRLIKVEQRNKFSVGEQLELFGADIGYHEITVTEMFDEDMNPIESAPHAQQTVYIRVNGIAAHKKTLADNDMTISHSVDDGIAVRAGMMLRRSK